MKHGAGAAVARLGEGAAHRRGSDAGSVTCSAHFVMCWKLSEALKFGHDVGLVARVAAGDDDQRHRLRVRLRDGAEGVLRAGAGLHCRRRRPSCRSSCG